jgi:hypothetical protein
MMFIEKFGMKMKFCNGRCQFHPSIPNDFHGDNMGSNPIGEANHFSNLRA